MDEQTQPQADWKPLGSIERRVLGVLVEKAKTTPDAYPLTLNSLRNGCNQKSNRDPQMDLNEDQVEDALETLRRAGAVLEVQGGGRTAKYRHAIYEWMGVDKIEAAVMTELLLRGAQTVGELRGRAARMEPITDLAALKPVVDTLKSRGLVIGLNAEGRGHIVTHALFTEREMERLKSQHSGADFNSAPPESPTPSHAPTASSALERPTSMSEPIAVAERTIESSNLANDLAELRAEFSAAQRQLEETIADLQQRVDELERFRQDVEG